MKDERRYCPLHGDYLPRGRSAECPDCSQDPAGSSKSLRLVRVLDEEQLDPEGEEDVSPTPLAEMFDCPVCGSSVPGPDFRVEAAGEVWLGDAAVWAEEGVCGDCYREVIAQNVREWSQSEWLVHHYEGWRKMAESAHDIVVHEFSPQESWLPEEERHSILDLEATLAARREHLARCQMAMEELQARHSVDTTPPPFQMTLASASGALSESAVQQLRLQREADLRVESELRMDSVYGVPVYSDDDLGEDGVATIPEVPSYVPEEQVPEPKASRGINVMLALLVIAVLTSLCMLWFVFD